MFAYLLTNVLLFGLIQMGKPLISNVLSSIEMLVLPLRILLQPRVRNARVHELHLVVTPQVLVVSVDARFDG